MQSARPMILGLGGTTRPKSSSELALRAALRAVERSGGRTELLAGPDLALPLYAPESPERDARAVRLVELLRSCDGVIIASPGYHGTISGMLKNALDYAEDLARDPVPYLDGRPMGCIACAYGWQATGSTLNGLRSIAHALRAWPTPLGIAINSQVPLFDGSGACIDAVLNTNLAVMAQQMIGFVQAQQMTRDLARLEERALA
jgi:FMN reductase